jgi:hypothetical protein
MYYPSQSPGLKLAHEHTPWPRPYGAPTPGNGPPPQSPGFALYAPGVHLTHPGAHAFAGAPGLSHAGLAHYTSPQNGHVQHAASPGAGATEMPPPHWQSQLMKCDVRAASL